MGIVVSYRGALADLDRIEDFEDRVLDMALELGGQARIWRTACDSDPKRVVRGVVLDLSPGQETTSLLISPEGWLVGLADIEDAENGKLTELPWCVVKTQFGSVEGHVAVVEMFTALKAEFIPDLEVEDEGDYWNTRDVKLLAGKMAFLNAAISQLAEGPRQHGLTAEATEDPEILAARIARVAQVVHKTLKRPAEHERVHWDDDTAGLDEEGRVTPEEEARWDASFKENRRMQERVGRAIERHLAEGMSVEEAHEAAMMEETAAGLPQDPDDESDDFNEREDWRDNLPEELAEDDPAAADAWDDELSDDELSDEEETFEAMMRHPLQQRAGDLLMRLHNVLPREERSPGTIGVLMQGALDMSGGLAQALCFKDRDPFSAGLSVVQLKRALRGAAFAQGALFPIKADALIDEAVFEELHATLQGLHNDIYEEVRRRRA
jgi:hypothetical protein